MKINTPIEELVGDHPSEFVEFMNYCRALKFEQDPDYKYCQNLFTGCLSRHNFDPSIFDFTWKVNRLAKEKKALKNSLMNILIKKPKRKDEVATEEQKAQDQIRKEEEKGDTFQEHVKELNYK